ncbi:YihY/virulence factor BrkB family protein [Microcella sp.]|uniref:YihY/virulence factor BrkB family protein n=1 Tax=Microcella sp. TaxID=1913979 RepID=UPI003918B862
MRDERNDAAHDSEPDGQDDGGLKAKVMPVVETVKSSRPVRAFQRYLGASGPILASGLAFQALFAVFAGLWVGFAIFGTVISANSELRDSVFAIISESVPGLIDDGSGNGAIDPDVLLSAQVFGLTGAIALVGLLVTALGFLNAARGATRQLFDLPPAPENFLKARLRDLGLTVGFGVLIIVSAALSVIGTQATDFLLDLVGIDDSTLARVLGRILTLSIMFAVDAVALAALFRILSEVRIPWRHLREGVLIGAAGLGGLKIAGGLLLGGASSNPLIASFAVIVGLLIWFNFVCQVILITGAWIATSVKDDDIILDEAVFAARLEAARALVREHGMGDEDEADARGGIFARLKRRLSRR